jgi:sterol desaturase/sphingolipid hydroxylase (fatty acid hydroxylase superfamily)
MEKIIDKISAYNLFNYLLPGVLFAVFAKNFLFIDLAQGDIILDVFIYYFVGLVISRFGSLIIEKFLKKINFLKFAEHEDFVLASKNDSKIEVLSRENNIYRTFIAMLVLLLLSKLYFYFRTIYPCLQNWDFYTLIFLFLAMFLYSYRKQTAYIYKRINSARN